MQLRCKASVKWPPTPLPANVRVPLDGVTGMALDLELVFSRGSSMVAGIMLQSWAVGQGSAAILYDWDNSVLEVRPAPALLQCQLQSVRVRGRISTHFKLSSLPTFLLLLLLVCSSCATTMYQYPCAHRLMVLLPTTRALAAQLSTLRNVHRS